MGIQENFQTLLISIEPNLKAGIDQIRYDLARKGLTKTPPGTEIYLEQSINLLTDEIFKALNEIKADIYKPKEWDLIRSSLNEFIEGECNAFLDFLVGNWEQPASQVAIQLNILKSSLLKECHTYIDRQKIKLSKGEQVSKDILKIVYYGLAAGIVGFLLKVILSR